MIVDSLLYYRHHAMQTDLLARQFPDLSRQKAIDIQLAMFKKELDNGARHIGWKMGGTVTDDSTAYDPVFGYILDSNLIEQDSTILAKNFPGGSVAVEGEIGFVINKDFKNGVKSMQELKHGIDYVTNAVEFAKSIAIPSDGGSGALTPNHVLASGAGQAGMILGRGRANVENFNMENETVTCFIDDTLAAKGIGANVYGGPIHALYSLANLLPKYDHYLEKGDVVITGSLYNNPTIKSTSDVRLDFSSLGSIHFNMK